MPNQNTHMDRIFHALSDATRMAVLTQLSEGPASVSELAEPFDMALPSFTQHLGVLEACHLVRSEKKGRVRTYALEEKTMRRAEDWLQKRRQMWEERLDRLDNYLLQMKEQDT